MKYRTIDRQGCTGSSSPMNVVIVLLNVQLIFQGTSFKVAIVYLFLSLIGWFRWIFYNNTSQQSKFGFFVPRGFSLKSRRERKIVLMFELEKNPSNESGVLNSCRPRRTQVARTRRSGCKSRKFSANGLGFYTHGSQKNHETPQPGEEVESQTKHRPS